MANALVAAFKGKKRPPKFGDEGEPDMVDAARGGEGGDMGDMGDDSESSASPDDQDAGGMGTDPEQQEQQAIDDLSDILGVGPEDRTDFMMALKAYVSACVELTLKGDEAGPSGPSEGVPEPTGGY